MPTPAQLKNLKPWKPGQSGCPTGRRTWLHKIDEMCAKDGKHPYSELMRLLPDLRPREQAEVWLQLLSYCQAKPKPVEEPEKDELSDLPTEDLVSLVKDGIKALEAG